LPPDRTIAATHKRLLSTIKNPHHYKLLSHRENKGSGALQVVLAVPKPTSPVRKNVLFADIDIDGSNPSYDLTRFLSHVGHLVQANTTDHFKIRRRIAARTGDFLYYDAVRV
jgi:hypothetical protein